VFDAWVASGQQDNSRLLRGQALKDAQTWGQGKSLSDLDYQFLASSQEIERQEFQLFLEAERLKEVEARLALKKKSVQRQTYLMARLSLALAIAIAAGIFAFSQYQKALVGQRNEEIEKIQGMARYSSALFALDKRLDALIEVLKARRELKHLAPSDPQTEAIDFSGLSVVTNSVAPTEIAAAICKASIAPKPDLFASCSALSIILSMSVAQ
jgi:hypothetical protein